MGYWWCDLVETTLHVHQHNYTMRWVNICRYNALVCNQPLKPTQPVTLSGLGNKD